MKNEEYKKLSIAEFTKAAGRYESNHAGIYEMCKKDYPDILEELEEEPFRDLLDAGCGPAPMVSLLAEKYPDRHYTGLDLTPAMIEQAKKKNISTATFVVSNTGASSCCAGATSLCCVLADTPSFHNSSLTSFMKAAILSRIEPK